MSLEEILSLITNNGFAIFVAVYMIIYNNKSMQGLCSAVEKASHLLQTLVDRLNAEDARNNE